MASGAAAAGAVAIGAVAFGAASGGAGSVVTAGVGALSVRTAGVGALSVRAASVGAATVPVVAVCAMAVSATAFGGDASGLDACIACCRRSTALLGGQSWRASSSWRRRRLGEEGSNAGLRLLVAHRRKLRFVRALLRTLDKRHRAADAALMTPRPWFYDWGKYAQVITLIRDLIHSRIVSIAIS